MLHGDGEGKHSFLTTWGGSVLVGGDVIAAELATQLRAGDPEMDLLGRTERRGSLRWCAINLATRHRIACGERAVRGCRLQRGQRLDVHRLIEASVSVAEAAESWSGNLAHGRTPGERQQ